MFEAASVRLKADGNGSHYVGRDFCHSYLHSCLEISDSCGSNCANVFPQFYPQEEFIWFRSADREDQTICPLRPIHILGYFRISFPQCAEFRQADVTNAASQLDTTVSGHTGSFIRESHHLRLVSPIGRRYGSATMSPTVETQNSTLKWIRYPCSGGTWRLSHGKKWLSEPCAD